MRNILKVIMGIFLLLAGCSSNIERDIQEVQVEDKGTEKTVIQNYQLDDESYRMIFPFKPSQARGLVVANLSNRLDMEEYEMGLMRISKDMFPPSRSYYQEGQYLDKKTVRAWLKRKYTAEQHKALEKELKTTIDNIGLNPIDLGKGTLEERNERSPIYLSNILEQNYLVKNQKGKIELAGISIGLAMNSVHYYTQEKGYPREEKIPTKELEIQGKKMAQEVVSRIRGIEGLEKVPITIAIFKLEPKSSIKPGNFLAKATVQKGETKVSDWERIKERYVIFPSDEGMKNYRDDAVKFDGFKSKIIEYFPNYTGVIGTGYYSENQLKNLVIRIPIQFYSQSEVLGFTQYVAGLVVKYFPNEIKVQVQISSINEEEAVIVRDYGEDKPFVHIYE